ncbi:MAG: hypothetical protein HY236_04805 [Acidobacteria bacterium]|nr:hypothetical protein [Acidobacteriota bacterium]
MWALTLIGGLSTVLALWLIGARWESAMVPCTPGGGPGPSEKALLTMVILMGTLGGLLHYSSSLALLVGNRRLRRSWVVYYLLMPLEGASLAVVFYLLFRVGVLNPTTSTGGGTCHLNFIGIYGFAALAGLFTKQALEMLADVFGSVFKRVQAKDPAVDAGRRDYLRSEATGK